MKTREGTAIFSRVIKHHVEIEFDGVQIAALFWDLDNTEQALFFNSMGMVDKLPEQLQVVTDSEELTASGRRAMDLFGQYATDTKERKNVTTK